VEPVRVKVYGLFSLTRRRYLAQAAAGAVCAFLMLAAWWLGWPWLRARLAPLPVTPTVRLILAVLERAPWLLLAALLCKGAEMVIVLRRFSRKEKVRQPAEVP